MDTLKIIEKLVNKAKTETAPVVDVADRVMLQLQVRAHETLRMVPLSVFAGASAIAASIILFLAFNAWMSMQDPMNAFYGPVEVATIW